MTAHLSTNMDAHTQSQQKPLEGKSELSSSESLVKEISALHITGAQIVKNCIWVLESIKYMIPLLEAFYINISI